MRSALVFTANSRVSNPFLLCHFVRLATKAFHKNGVAVPETINKVLIAMGEQTHALMPGSRPVPATPKTDVLAGPDLTNLELARSAFNLMAANLAPATS